MQPTARSISPQPKSTSSLDHVPFDVKKQIADYFPDLKTARSFELLGREYFQASDHCYRIALKNPPQEMGICREVFYSHPENRQIDLVTVDRVGKDFFARFKDGFLCLDMENDMISFGSKETVFGKTKRMLGMNPGTESYSWKLPDGYFAPNIYAPRRKIIIDLQHINKEISDSDSKDTLLTFSCRYNIPIMVKILLSHPDISVNNSTEYGDFPIFLAARNGYWKIVELLLKMRGIDLDRGDYRTNHTALTMAVDGGHLKVVELLLAADSELEVDPWSGGVSALNIARKKCDKHIVALLENYLKRQKDFAM